MSFPELYKKVKIAAEGAAARAKKISYSDLWERLASVEQAEIQRKLSLNRDQDWYGAVPSWEPTYYAHDTEADPISVAGVDGSQIYSVSESPVHWAYIRAIACCLGEESLESDDFIDIGLIEADSIHHKKENFFGFSDDQTSVNNWRSLLELRLAARATNEFQNTLVLLDNPLLPRGGWRPGSEQEMRSITKLIDQMRGKMVAGYTSSPKSRLLANMVTMYEFGPENHQSIPVDDSQLMMYGLKAGQRSALFLHGSLRNNDLIKNGAGIYLFFVKVGSEEIARVEIPEWVTDSTTMVDTIHASILKESEALSYPYCLMSAHYKVAIPLSIGEELNRLAIKTYIESGGRYSISAKMRMKRPG